MFVYRIEDIDRDGPYNANEDGKYIWATRNHNKSKKTPIPFEDGIRTMSVGNDYCGFDSLKKIKNVVYQ